MKVKFANDGIIGSLKQLCDLRDRCHEFFPHPDPEKAGWCEPQIKTPAAEKISDLRFSEAEVAFFFACYEMLPNLLEDFIGPREKELRMAK